MRKLEDIEKIKLVVTLCAIIIVSLNLMLVAMGISKSLENEKLRDEIKSTPKPRDYQIEIREFGQLVYSGNRLVGVLRFSNSSLDSLIIKDNE